MSGPGTGKASIRKQAWASTEPSSSIKQPARASACQIVAWGREFENIAPAARSLWIISDFALPLAVVETRREKCRAFDYGRSILGLFSCRGLTSSLPRRRDSLLPYNQTINDIVTRCVVCVKFSKSEVGMIKSQIDRTEYFRMCFKLVQRRER
jgi:hypothetical protein